MISRRGVLMGAAGIAGLSLVPVASGQQVYKDVARLQPGEFTWDPDLSPDGPVAIIVSLPEQRTHVYRNGIRIAVSTCSTGKPGHETPTGVFTILQKDADHHSSTYNNAPMPNMNRLTWSGIALHAGNLPGYPASHGCVRLPLEFSSKLFGVTHVGTPVIISGASSDPWEITHPGMVLAGYAENEFETVVASLDGKSHPSDWEAAETKPVTTIIASSADTRIDLIENGEIIANGEITIEGPPVLGEHVLVLQGADQRSRGMTWQGITHSPDPAFPRKAEALVIDRIRASEAFRQQMQAHMHPGMVFIITDLPLHPDRRTGDDFVIMTS